MNISPNLPPYQPQGNISQRQVPPSQGPSSQTSSGEELRLNPVVSSEARADINRTRVESPVRIEEQASTQRISPEAVEVIRSQRAVVDIENLPERNRQALNQYLSIENQPDAGQSSGGELVGVDTFV